MDFVSVRVITDDVERLATFWEQVTGLPANRPVPVFAELRTSARGLVPQTVPEIVLAPTEMPWGNRSVILRDPDGGLANLSTPVIPEAKAKYGL